MAEAVLFSLTGKVLGDLSSKTLKKAYERVQSDMDARNELDELQETIESIHLVVLDAEKKQEKSVSVKNWIRRVRDELYEADDLSDDVFAADALLQEEEEKKKGNKVGATISEICKRIISNDDIAKRVKAIRKSLDRISHDMKQFNFIQSRCENEVTDLRKTAKTRPFVNEKFVFGREDEKKAIIELLLSDDAAEKSMPVQVIAIVGIGGMGKTTLAQLVYNDEQVAKMFQKKWWACISDVPGKAHVLGRISQSMVKNCDSDCPEELICEEVSSSGKYLLVLDDVWDFENNDRAMWYDIMSLLLEGTKGSKILVTTRFSSVPRDMHKDKSQIYDLKGLSEEKSWQLFKDIAFTEEQENSSEWISIGKEILNKCVNVPLAIKSIAGLLRTKYTLGEWEAFKEKELLKMESGEREGSIMHSLRLSYNYLPSDLKHCFANCSLFPKDSCLIKKQLIHLWIAQGYCMPKDETETPEGNGHAYFMELLKRCFFQEVRSEGDGKIYYKMHDLIHDLAQDVAREESIVQVEGGSRQLDKKIRHLSVDGRLCDSWDGPPLELKAERLRSLMLTLPSRHSFVLNQRFTEFKSLRTLSLQGYEGSDVPSCIGELRHLRYLNLAGNRMLSVLPDSITKLVNLLTLDLRNCDSLVALPNEFRKLISLRHLDITECDSLNHMPPKFGELTCLKQLSHFKVCKRGSGLDSLANMSLQGSLRLFFDKDDVAREETIQIPHTLKELQIKYYPGVSVSTWWKEDLPHLPQLVILCLSSCKSVKNLPPLRCLPFLKELALEDFEVLEYIEDGISSITSFFPSLRTLELTNLPKLKRLSGSFFPHLAVLDIRGCPDLDSMPLSPDLEKLYLCEVGEKIVHQLVSTSNASLQIISIKSCDSLKSFRGEGLTSLRELELDGCYNLEKVQLASNALQELILDECPKLELIKSCNLENVQLDSEEHPDQSFFPHLTYLDISTCPVLDSMPRCLYIQNLYLYEVGEKIVHQLVSISNASLQDIKIKFCDSLKSFRGEGLTSLRRLELYHCSNLEKVQLASNALQEFIFSRCPKVELWGHTPNEERGLHWASRTNLRRLVLDEIPTPNEEKKGLHWASLPNLRRLVLDEIPQPEQLPHCLRNRTTLGKLKIQEYGWRLRL